MASNFLEFLEIKTSHNSQNGDSDILQLHPPHCTPLYPSRRGSRGPRPQSLAIRENLLLQTNQIQIVHHSHHHC
ncbi:hypothetical protein T439DRAFT_325493 [Meredithblackwellia eburnea MCA 4105]